MLHQFFDLPKLPPTLVALVPFKHNINLPPAVIAIVFVIVVIVVPPVPALPAEVALYLPGRFGMVKKQS